MIFYKYTINKMLRSVSTYITGAFGVLPILVLGILGMTGKGYGYQMTSLVAIATFPLFVVFITFKTVQVFREEIENQTMLTIVSKPFPRKKLVFEGLLSLFTLIAALAFVGIFIPMLGYIRTEPNTGEVFLKAFLVMLTTILLGSIVATLGLLLSLKAKGKSFIGIMLAIFGIAFYALWGTMVGLRVMTSRGHAINEYNNNMNVSITNDVNSGTGIVIGDRDVTYTIKDTPMSYGGVKVTSNTDPAHDVYESFRKLGDFKAMDFVNWIDPTLHWQTLYNGAASVGDQKSSIFSMITSGVDNKVVIKSAVDNHDGSYTIVARITKKALMPIYYPIIIWLLIGGVVVGLSFRTLNKSNIS